MDSQECRTKAEVSTSSIPLGAAATQVFSIMESIVSKVSSIAEGTIRSPLNFILGNNRVRPPSPPPMRKSSRERNATWTPKAFYLIPTPEPKKRQKKDKKTRREERMARVNSKHKWDVYRQTIRQRMSGVMREVYYLEVLTHERREETAAMRKAKLESVEVKQCMKKLTNLKLSVRGILQKIYDEDADHIRWPQLSEECADADGHDIDDVNCSKCGLDIPPDAEEADEEKVENDIMFCDRKGCCRAYHQRCLDPPLLPDEKTQDPDEDWFCHRCECLDDCLYEISEVLEMPGEFVDHGDVFTEALGEGHGDTDLDPMMSANMEDDSSDDDFHADGSDDDDDDDDDDEDQGKVLKKRKSGKGKAKAKVKHSKARGSTNQDSDDDDDDDDGELPSDIEDSDIEEDEVAALLAEANGEDGFASTSPAMSSSSSSSTSPRQTGTKMFARKLRASVRQHVDENGMYMMYSQPSKFLNSISTSKDLAKRSECVPKGPGDVGREVAIKVRKGVLLFGKIISFTYHDPGCRKTEKKKKKPSKSSSASGASAGGSAEYDIDKKYGDTSSWNVELMNDEQRTLDVEEIVAALKLYSENSEYRPDSDSGNESEGGDEDVIDESNILPMKRVRKRVDYATLNREMYGSLADPDDSDDDYDCANGSKGRKGGTKASKEGTKVVCKDVHDIDESDRKVRKKLGKKMTEMGRETVKDGKGAVKRSKDGKGAVKRSKDGKGAVKRSKDGKGAVKRSKDGKGAVKKSSTAPKKKKKFERDSIITVARNSLASDDDDDDDDDDGTSTKRKRNGMRPARCNDDEDSQRDEKMTAKKVSKGPKTTYEASPKKGKKCGKCHKSDTKKNQIGSKNVSVKGNAKESKKRKKSKCDDDSMESSTRVRKRPSRYDD